jgi:hypothetical protein
LSDASKNNQELHHNFAPVVKTSFKAWNPSNHKVKKILAVSKKCARTRRKKNNETIELLIFFENDQILWSAPECLHVCFQIARNLEMDHHIIKTKV